jgi:hypothetical protein
MKLQHYHMTDVASKQFLRVNYQVKKHPTVIEVHLYQTQDSMAEELLIVGRTSQFL